MFRIIIKTGNRFYTVVCHGISNMAFAADSKSRAAEKQLWQSKMSSIEPKYSTGEAIFSGDKIKYDGEMGEVDFTITRESNDWYTYWNELGEGVMLKVPSFGSVYVPFSDEDLEFISRKSDFLRENG